MKGSTRKLLDACKKRRAILRRGRSEAARWTLAKYHRVMRSKHGPKRVSWWVSTYDVAAQLGNM